MRERVVGGKLQRVADGVAEVQHVADAELVVLVLLDDVGLQADALRDDVSKRRRIEREHFLQRVSFELLEK